MKKFLLFIAAVLSMSTVALAKDFYLIGGFNGWTTSDANCKFVAKGNNVYELNYKGELTSGFKVNDGTWSNDNFNFGSNGSKLEKGKPYTMGVGGSSANIEITGAITNPKLVLDVTDLTAPVITITGEDAVVEVGYQIWGCFDGGTDWGGPEFEKVTDDEWTAFVECTAPGEFGIKELGNGVQTSWLAGAAAGIVIGGENTGIDLVTVDTNNFQIMPNDKGYTMTLHPVSMKLDVKVGSIGSTGIADITVDNVAPVYYNLQGVRVAQPESGLYIEVRGNKVAKVIL